MIDDSNVVGEVSWDDLADQEQSQPKTERKMKGLTYLNMKFPGDYQVRVTQRAPTPYYCHWVDAKIKDEMGNVTVKRRKVNCSQDSECPECIKPPNQGPEQKFYLRVFDRTTNTLKILDCGIQIVGGIAKLKKKDSWGDPRNYDIIITKNVKGSNPLYTLSPEPKTPFTPEELGMIDESETEGSDLYCDFKKLQAPWPAKRITAVLTGESYNTRKVEVAEEVAEEMVSEAEMDENIDLGDEEFMDVEE